MTQRYDVLLPGSYFCDLIFTGLPELPRLGLDLFGTGFDMMPGACFYTVQALHRLGLRTGWACDFGNDFCSRFVLDEAAREGFDQSLFQLHDRPLRSISVSFSYAHDRGFISYMDEFKPTSRVPLIERHQPRCLLLSSLRMGEEQARMVAATHAYGGIVFMDCQWHPETLDDAPAREAIERVDIFAPNRAEALHLTGAETPEQALAILAKIVPLVLIKLGADGVIAQRGDEVWRAPALPVEVVDTTGAGDSFNAGFLYGYLRGAPMEECLRCGSICGSLSTTARGGSMLPTAKQLRAMLAE